MIAPPANPYGRKRHEVPTFGELVELIQSEQLPHSEEAESAIISSWMHNPDLLDEDAVQIGAFHNEAHRTVAGEMMSLKLLGKLMYADGHFDVPLFTHHLRNRELLERAGGPPALVDYFQHHTLPSHYPHYRRILTDCFQRRQLLQVLALGIHQLQTLGRTDEHTLSTCVEQLQREITDVEADDDSADIPCRPIEQIINTVVEKAEYRANNPGVLPGVSTGIARLDELTGGLQPGRLWAVLAASSEGKSSLCRQFVEQACKQGHAGVIYTYEMMDDEEGARMICSQGIVSSSTMKSGRFSRAELEGLQSACREIKGWHIDVVDVAGRYIEDIHRDIVRRKKRLREGQELVVMIDYIQLALTRKKSDSRQREIAHVTGSTKQTAKRARCTILMPSQVNKEGEAREGMDIEQDADVEIKIIKPELKKTKKQHWKKEGEEDEEDPITRAKRLLKIAKNRDGAKGDSIPVRMVGEHFRFAEFQPEQQELL